MKDGHEERRIPKHMEKLEDESLNRSRDESTGGLFDKLAICLLLVYGANCFYFWYMKPTFGIALMSLVSIAVLGSLWWFLRKNRGNRDVLTKRIFPVLFVSSCVLYALFFTPFSVPDEAYHYYKSYTFANILLGQDDLSLVRTEDYLFLTDEKVFHAYMDGDSWKNIADKFSLFAKNEGMVDYAMVIGDINFGTNCPQLKLVPALSIVLARSLNLSGIATYYFGRLCNALFCAALLVLAVRKMPLGKSLLMSVCLLPMTLHLVGSYSYDGCIIAFSFLLLANLLDMILDEGRATIRQLLGVLLLGICLAPCKVVYSPLVLLSLFVPQRRFSSKAAMICWKALMIVGAVAAIIVLRTSDIIRVSGVARSAQDSTISYRGTETGVHYSPAYLLAHPLASIAKIVRTFRSLFWPYMEGVVGKAMGWFQGELGMTEGQVVGLFMLLPVSSIPSEDDSNILTRQIRLALFCVFILAFAGAFMSMMLDWTFITDDVVNGMQGRYLLPALPCFLLSIRGKLMSLHIRTMPVIILIFGSFSWFLCTQMAFNLLVA